MARLSWRPDRPEGDEIDGIKADIVRLLAQ
jgi:hypothetical protein